MASFHFLRKPLIRIVIGSACLDNTCGARGVYLDSVCSVGLLCFTLATSLLMFSIDDAILGRTLVFISSIKS